MPLHTHVNGFQGEIAGKLSCGCLFALGVQEIDTKALHKFGKLTTWSTLHPEPRLNQNTSLSSHEHLKVLILLIQICFRPGPAKMKGYF